MPKSVNKTPEIIPKSQTLYIQQKYNPKLQQYNKIAHQYKKCHKNTTMNTT